MVRAALQERAVLLKTKAVHMKAEQIVAQESRLEGPGISTRSEAVAKEALTEGPSKSGTARKK